MTPPVPVEQVAAAYARYWEDLRPETVERIDQLATPDIHFRDPFNDFHDRERLKRTLSHMFHTLGEPRFTVRDRAISGRTAYLRWNFTFRLGNKEHMIDGMSEVRFDHTGRAAGHIDHWDAASQVYEKVPLLGGLIRLVKRRLAD